MNDTLSVMSAQLAPRVGDIAGNMRMLAAAIDLADQRKCDIALCPELSLIGYPPDDLLCRDEVISTCRDALTALARQTRKDRAGCVVGTPLADNGRLYNAVALIADGEIQAIRCKHMLPNYGVFDEKRWFAPGDRPQPIDFRGRRLGVPICEDVFTGNVLATLAEKGAEIFLAASSSPWETGKPAQREADISARVASCAVPCVMVNRAGAHDDLVFDGASFVLDADGRVLARLADFTADTGVSRWKGQGSLTFSDPRAPTAPARTMEQAEEIYTAVMTGVRSYVDSAGFSQVLLGLSGGIDSALTAALCADALGPDRVSSVMMPFDHTGSDSIRDAQQCAEALGIAHSSVSIGAAVETLTPLAQGQSGLARQNLQSRIRGTILMTRANASGAMVVATGNKSEFACGYCTLYGDMCGGFAPLKDVYKTQVWQLARWRNRRRPAGGLGTSESQAIPDSIIARPPSAELCDNQVDEDTLPPYAVLDPILRAMIEDRMSIQNTARITGASTALCQEIAGMVTRSEHKRRQAPPGVRVTSADFGRGRRYPITNGWPGAV